MSDVLEKMELRRARLEDSEIVLSWRNEPGTVPWMKTKRPLRWDEHHPWFTKAVSNPSILFLIIEVGGVQVGQLRYDKEGDLAKVSINITETWHGKGVASKAFRLGSEFVKSSGFASCIFARVLTENKGSIRSMLSAGYKIVEEFTNEDGPHLYMTHQLETIA